MRAKLVMIRLVLKRLCFPIRDAKSSPRYVERTPRNFKLGPKNGPLPAPPAKVPSIVT
jgi:hypothetical protein